MFALQALQAVDDGFVHGKLDLADLFFLIAAILAGVAAIFTWQVAPPRPLWATLVAAALCLGFLGFFVL